MQLMIIYVGVGNMTPDRVKEHCSAIRSSFREALGLHDIKMVILPQGSPESRVELINLAD